MQREFKTYGRKPLFAENGLTASNLTSITGKVSTYGKDPWCDRPAPSCGFAKPKTRVLYRTGLGFGTSAATYRREKSFSHPDFDR